MQSRLSREQLYTLLALQRRGDGIFKGLPKDIIQYMATMQNKLSSNINCLLSAIAYGNLDTVKNILEYNSRLVMECGDTQTPSGLIVTGVSPFECALGAGDPEIAGLIYATFDRITDEHGNPVADALKVRDSQYERYRPHINSIDLKKPYDFQWIFDAVYHAKNEEIDAILERQEGHTSPLSDALNRFKEEYSVQNTTAGNMHFRYADITALVRKLLGIEIFNTRLLNATRQVLLNPNYEITVLKRLRLVNTHVLSYALRNIPAFERMAIANGIDAITLNDTTHRIIRSFKAPDAVQSFPVTANDDSRTGLGFDLNYSECSPSTRAMREIGNGAILSLFELKSKTMDINLIEEHAERFRSSQQEQTSTCIIS